MSWLVGAPRRSARCSLVAAFASRFGRMMPLRRASGSDSALRRSVVRFLFIKVRRPGLLYVVHVRCIAEHIRGTVVNARDERRPSYQVRPDLPRGNLGPRWR